MDQDPRHHVNIESEWDGGLLNIPGAYVIFFSGKANKVFRAVKGRQNYTSFHGSNTKSIAETYVLQ